MKKLIILVLILTAGFYCQAQTAINTKKLHNKTTEFDRIPVFRLQFRVTTSNVKNHDSDKPAWVKFNDKDPEFFLSKQIDNFQRGHTDTYDIISHNITNVGDIHFIKIGQGNGEQDYWGISNIELLLNNNANPIFSVRFDKPFMINGDKTIQQGFVGVALIANKNELRGHPGWQLHDRNRTIGLMPSEIPSEFIKSLAEASMGNYISHTPGSLSWSSDDYGRCVQIKQLSTEMMRVTFKLDAKIRHQPNPEVNIFADMKFVCKDGRLLISSERSGVSNGETLWEQLMPDFIEKIWIALGKGFRKVYMKTPLRITESINPIFSFTGALYKFDFSTPEPELNLPITECQQLIVLPDASIRFSRGGQIIKTTL